MALQPLGKPLNLKASNYTKLEEAIMQVGFYTWGWAYNAAFLVKQDWFWNPIICFLDNFPRQANEYVPHNLATSFCSRATAHELVVGTCKLASQTRAC
jgi:hypothetical protein